MKKVVSLSPIFALLLATGTQAATISDSDSILRSFENVVRLDTTTETPSKTESVTNQKQTALKLDQFDAALGTLTGIRITTSATALRLFGSVTISCKDKGLLNSDCRRESASQSATSSAQVDPPFDGSGYAENTAFDVAASDFGSFIGTGNIFIPWRLSYRHTLSATCRPSDLTSIDYCRASAKTTFRYDVSASVVYTYDEPLPPSAVPLPAGMPLLLAGLGGFAALRRRKTSQAAG